MYMYDESTGIESVVFSSPVHRPDAKFIKFSWAMPPPPFWLGVTSNYCVKTRKHSRCTAVRVRAVWASVNNEKRHHNEV